MRSGGVVGQKRLIVEGKIHFWSKYTMILMNMRALRLKVHSFLWPVYLCKS